MKIGVFVPIGNNGWLISTHAPQYMPTFELNVTSSNRRPYGRNHRLNLWRAFWRQPRDWLAKARV